MSGVLQALGPSLQPGNLKRVIDQAHFILDSQLLLQHSIQLAPSLQSAMKWLSLLPQEAPEPVLSSSKQN